MRSGARKISFITLIIFILTGFSSFAYCPSTSSDVAPLDVVTFGDISSTMERFEYHGYVSKIALEDINAYMEEKGYDVRFDAVLENADGLPSIHYEKVQAFKSMGIDLVIGGGWSSMAQASLSYMNDNGMLLISPSATSPLLSIPDDSFYRVCPTDGDAGKILSEMIARYGVQGVVVIQRDDSWGDGLFDTFNEDFRSRGGVVVDRIKYSVDTTDYFSVMSQAEEATFNALGDYGYGNVGVMILSLDEAASLVYYAFEFLDITYVPWFGWAVSGDYGGYAYSVLEGVPEEASILRLLSPMTAPSHGAKYQAMRQSIYDEYGYNSDFYAAATYDAYWLLAMSVLEAGTSDAVSVKRVLPDVAYGYSGASGICTFDQYGDRLNTNYNIWGMDYNETPAWEYYGYYNSSFQRIFWPLDAPTTELGPVYRVYSPSYGFSDNPVRFRLRVFGNAEQYLSDTSVNLFIDGVFQEGFVTDYKGEVSTSYSLESGDHTWYAEIVVNDVSYNTNEHSFSVDKLYNLKVISEYGVTTGEGAYPYGETVSFSVSPTEFTVDVGERVAFSGWTCYSEHGYIGEENPASLIITDNTNEIAGWNTQYYIDIVEGEGNVLWGEGWHNQGERVTLEAEESSGFLIRTVFDGWSGDLSYTSNPTNVIVTKPITVYANWRKDYTNLFLVAGLGLFGVVVLGYRSRRQGSTKRKIEDEYKRERDYVQELIGADSIIDITALKEMYGLRDERARELLSQAVNDRNLIGFYSRDGSKFVKMVHIRRSIRQRLDLPH
jgi:branched-chain amino acid transport system substrate-binding protein